jgi:hypothetical protein
VEDPPLPVTVSGVLMLPVHLAFQNNPSFGFDLSRVVLVLYQNLQRMPGIEQPQPPAPPPPQSETPAADSPAQPEAPGEDAGAARSNDTPPSTTIVPWQSPFVGDWKNVYSAATGLTRLLITSDGDKLLVHAWHSCFPEDCDWGTAAVDSSPAKGFFAVWNLKDASQRLQAHLGDDGRLRVDLQTHYLAQNAHVDSNLVFYFTRSASTP